MNVIEILKAYLKEHGYDGLYYDKCGCLVDDIAPCGMEVPDCKAGYRHDYAATDKCGCDDQGEAHWHVEEKR